MQLCQYIVYNISKEFSFERRNLKEYIIERIKKLLVPLLFGIIFLVPPQTYLARVWRGEVNLNYFSHLDFFFSNVTDFTGFDGAFTPAHLWFILYLFVISILGGIILFIALIIILSAILTFLVYELLNKIKIFNFVLGIK